MDGFKLISKHRNSIMGMAALLILVFHTWVLRFSHIPILGTVEAFVRQNGFMGVDIFLFVSGYGLFYSMEKGKLLKYYANRCLRLLPATVFAAALYSIVYSKGFVFFIQAVTGYGFYFKTIFFFLWYLTVIISISLVFPLYYLLMKKCKSDILFTSLAIAVWFVLSFALRNGPRSEFYGVTNRLVVFMLGVLCASLSKRKSVSFGLGHWVIILLSFVAGIYCIYLNSYKGVEFILPMSNCFIPAILFALPLTFLWAGLCEVCQNGKVCPGVFKGIDKIFSFVGKISLELYCIQEILVYSLRNTEFFKKMGVLTNNIVSIVIAILAAFILSLILNCYKYIVPKKAPLAEN